MAFLLDILKLLLKDTEVYAKLKIATEPFLTKFKGVVEQYHKTKSHFALEQYLTKLNPLESKYVNEFIQKINVGTILKKQLKQMTPIQIQKLNLTKETKNYIKNNITNFQKSNYDAKTLEAEGENEKFNIFINMNSSAIKGAIFIPTIEVRSENKNKLVNVRGITQIIFKTNIHKKYDYYNISYQLFNEMAQAVGVKGDGAWSVYLEYIGHAKGERVKRTQTEIKTRFKNIATPKNTKSRKFITINKNIPTIKGIRKTK